MTAVIRGGRGDAAVAFDAPSRSLDPFFVHHGGLARAEGTNFFLECSADKRYDILLKIVRAEALITVGQNCEADDYVGMRFFQMN